MLVNGGGAVTLQFQRSPFRPLTRTVFVPWNQIVVLPPVAMQLNDDTDLFSHGVGSRALPLGNRSSRAFSQTWQCIALFTIKLSATILLLYNISLDHTTSTTVPDYYYVTNTTIATFIFISSLTY